ncbi:HK97-gp10 family putative phage morphogenesis protein [Virgibacillus dokdonensis]|uniref:HK97-gp10 family putative phage morphogenesis protein n=1 Tax=Virgibacillus dokdonensis TaxID=302167 RepID=A0ABU7VHK8_9BACI
MDLDDLIKQFDRMHDNIEDDVGEIVKNNTIEMTSQTVDNAHKRFNKGYATGYTARNIETEVQDKLHAKTISKSEHSGYLNYGTRFMDATWFLRDAYLNQREKVHKDLKRLVE